MQVQILSCVYISMICKKLLLYYLLRRTRKLQNRIASLGICSWHHWNPHRFECDVFCDLNLNSEVPQNTFVDAADFSFVMAASEIAVKYRSSNQF